MFFRMDVKTKVKLMHVMESYWIMLPPELQDFILLLKKNQEMFDEEKKKRMEGLSKEIVMYKELKEKWALGHIRCVVKKQVFFSKYIVIMGNYVDREDNVKRERFLGYDFPNAIRRINHVKSFM